MKIIGYCEERKAKRETERSSFGMFGTESLHGRRKRKQKKKTKEEEKKREKHTHTKQKTQLKT